MFMVIYYVQVLNNKNMNKRKDNTKKWVLIMLAVIVCIGLLVGFGVYRRMSNRVVAPKTGPTAAEIKQDVAINAGNKSKSITDDTDQPTTVQAASANVDFSARKETGASVTISTKLYGVSSGSCTLTILNGTKKLSRTAIVIYQPEFSTCAGFSVPVADLGGGLWNITTTVDYNGTSATKTITLEVN